MADGRLPSVTARPPQAAQPPGVRGAAQRAFFEAALGRTAPAAPAEPARQAMEPVVTPVQTTTVAREPEPGARYRPGALLDIKI